MTLFFDGVCGFCTREVRWLLKHRSHEVVPIDECLIAHQAIRAAPILGREWQNAHAVDAVTGSDGETAVLVHRPGNVVQQPYAGPSTVHEHVLGRDWELDPTAFWQVHPAAAQLLAQTVVELLRPRPGERAWDLSIVLSQTHGGPWLSCGVPFVPALEAIADFTMPDFKTPLPDVVRSEFLRNVEERGSGIGES